MAKPTRPETFAPPPVRPTLSTSTPVPEPAKIPTPAPPLWRVSIDLLSGKDLLLKFSSLGAALDFARLVLANGYFIDDRSADSSRYNSVFYPLMQIKSINVYEA